MVFGTAVGLELGLLLLYYREGDLCCLVLRPGIELHTSEISAVRPTDVQFVSCDSC